MTDEKIETINVSSDDTETSESDHSNAQERFGGPPMEEVTSSTRVTRRRSPSGSRRPVVRRPAGGK